MSGKYDYATSMNPVDRTWRGLTAIGLHLFAVALGLGLYLLVAPWCWLSIKLGHDRWRCNGGR
jgi:hypothetical protein